MKVKELIEVLQKCDPEFDVMLNADEDELTEVCERKVLAGTVGEFTPCVILA